MNYTPIGWTEEHQKASEPDFYGKWIKCESELKILENAFLAEINSGRGCHLLQTKGKTAKKLADDGMLNKRKITLGGKFPVTVEGYELTHAGRITYCDSCDT